MTSKLKGNKREERLTAYHEAGHAVAYYHLGLNIKFITIVPDHEQRVYGRVQPTGSRTFSPLERFGGAPSVLDARLDLEREVIINLAGYAAEINYSGQNSIVARVNLLRFGERLRVNSDEDPSGDGDLNRSRMYFFSLPMLHADVWAKDKEHDAYLKWLWYRAVNIVTAKESWAAVKALATALLEKKRLTGQQAKKIMAKEILFRMFHFLHHNAERAEAVTNEDLRGRSVAAKSASKNRGRKP